jgi:hypothetical protein
VNLYRYCRNNPLGRIDPSGNMSWPVWGVKQLGLWVANKVFSDCVPDDWQEALTLFSQWVRGEGPDEWVLGRGNALVEDLIGTEQIEGAMQAFRDANAGRPFEEWTPVTYQPYGKEGFTVQDAIDAGTNAALQMLGGFTVVVTPRESEDGSETITVRNAMSWHSFWRFVELFGWEAPESFPRDEWTPCGNMDTTMTWDASLLPPSPACPTGIHAAGDTCSVCGYCACYCGFRQHWGWCTILNRGH